MPARNVFPRLGQTIFNTADVARTGQLLARSLCGPVGVTLRWMRTFVVQGVLVDEPAQSPMALPGLGSSYQFIESNELPTESSHSGSDSEELLPDSRIPGVQESSDSDDNVEGVQESDTGAGVYAPEPSPGLQAQQPAVQGVQASGVQAFGPPQLPGQLQPQWQGLGV